MNLEFLAEARDEFFAAMEYYEEREPGLGFRFRKEVDSVTRKIAQSPLLWRERPAGYRRVNLPVFPYYLAYFVRERTVLIAAVAHHSREPDYWSGRI